LSISKQEGNMKTFRMLASAFALLLCAANVWGHGYVFEPQSRAFACSRVAGNTPSNFNCGDRAQFEPQSIENTKGGLRGGAIPADGQLASNGVSGFGPLDVQTATRWAKMDIQAGLVNFKWRFTAAHRTPNGPTGFQYFITRQNWDPNQPLTRNSFDLNPFCTIDGMDRQPATEVTHPCNVPSRTGYQVILATWDVADTTNGFISVIDVMFRGGNNNPDPMPQPEFTQRGTINPSVDLSIGDSVTTRVFDANGERTELNTRITINTAAEGPANAWSFKLATAINSQFQQSGLLRAGQRGANGTISPVFGANPVFARTTSPITRVEITINKAPVQGVDYRVDGVLTSYRVTNGRVTLNLSFSPTADIDINATVFDAANVSKGFTTVAVTNGGTFPATIVLNAPAPGAYKLVTVGTPRNGAAPVQKTFNFSITDPNAPAPAFDFIFPNGLANYVSGTRVLQQKDGRVYVCRPFPFGGFCRQYSPGSPAYEPGVGTNSADAWTLAQ
jgi:chitin-binding protein